MSKRFLLTLGTALVVGSLAIGAFAEEPSTGSGAASPAQDVNAGHHGMMGEMQGMHGMAMTRMMENCNRMMEGMQPSPSGGQQSKPDNG